VHKAHRLEFSGKNVRDPSLNRKEALKKAGE